MKKVYSTAALPALLLALATVNSSFAADWPQWRGSNRDGKVSGFNAPQTWPQQLSQKWKVTVGRGDSTPALVGDKLYTFGRQDPDEVILCLNATDGKVIWENRYATNRIISGPPSRHPGTRSSPVVAEGKVCTFGVGAILSCLDAATGKLLWRKQSAEDYLDTPLDSDVVMSPLVVDGCCIVGVGAKTNGAVIAFNLADGKAKWKWQGLNSSFGSPVVMTLNNTKVIVAVTVKSLVGLRASDGKPLWQIPFEAGGGSNNATPIVDGQTVIYSGQDKGMIAFQIEAKGDEFTVSQLWSNKDGGARFTTAILKDGFLYGYNAKFFCINAKTGTSCWTDTVSRGNSVALVDAGPVLVASCVNGELAVFRPDDKQYSEVARLKLGRGEIWAHPVLSANRVFVRDADTVALLTVD